MKDKVRKKLWRKRINECRKSFAQNVKEKSPGDYNVMTFAIGLLFAVNSIVNLIWTDKVYPVSTMYNSFLPNDCINLFLGIPVLIVSVILSLRHNRIGLIGWAGSLLFVF